MLQLVFSGQKALYKRPHQFEYNKRYFQSQRDRNFQECRSEELKRALSKSTNSSTDTTDQQEETLTKMGLRMSTLFQKLGNLFSEWGNRRARILMLGLDAAGKTTIVYKIKLNETVNTIPTIGFNVEEVSPVKNITFTVWDVGGQDKIRPLWRHYYQGTEGLIYVVDSADPERFHESKEELWAILDSPEMAGVPVVVIANKQDLPRAESSDKIAAHLGLLQKRDHPWFVQAACAKNGEGIYEAMHELAKMVKEFQTKPRGMQSF